MSRNVWIGRDLPPIRRDGQEYFLVSLDDALYLVLNRCPHRGGPLKLGHLNAKGELVCPWHHNCFAVERLVKLPTTIRLTEAQPADG